MGKTLFNISDISDDILQMLLIDRTKTGKATKKTKNIIWATPGYSGDNNEIQVQEVRNLSEGCTENKLQPRVYKRVDMQKTRTKTKAEVFTPSWLCCEMNNYCDNEWFGRENVFNVLSTDDKSWKCQNWAITKKYNISFDGLSVKRNKEPWQQYVELKKIEITCGEAPYIVSRYDTTTGNLISITQRIGFLDRKMRIVHENTKTYDEWLYWAIKAYQSTYGYEWQGDSLLIARINLFLSFFDYKKLKWKKVHSDEKETKRLSEIIAEIISWNLWQMDGLKYKTIWNSELERKEVSEDRERIRQSIDAVSALSLSDGYTYNDLVVLAQNDPLFKTKADDAIEYYYTASGLVFTKDVLKQPELQPGSGKGYFKKRKTAILKGLAAELRNNTNHEYYEPEWCKIALWKTSVNSAGKLNITKKIMSLSCYANDKEKKTEVDDRQMTIFDIRKN